MKLVLSALAALSFLSFTPAFAQVQAYNFDFDDNIFVTPARIAIWDTISQAELEVSTGYWALIKNKIGKEEPYANFSKRSDFLRNFSDKDDKSPFPDQIRQALRAPDERWKAPSWNAFVDALSREETRSRVAIITARLHSPRSILAGLQILKDRGLIPALPDLNHIYVVGWPGFEKQFKGTTDAESKANVMTYLLDDLERQAILAAASPLINREGTGTDKLHLWSFSDDDYENYSKALEALAPKVAAGRWPHVKIVLVYTGLNNPAHARGAVVLQSNGTTRPARADELSQMKY